jgi:hypothetical protein
MRALLLERGPLLKKHSQLTAQELTPMLRLALNPIVFVLNNKGYTIERYLHGKVRKYNDIVNWYAPPTCYTNFVSDPRRRAGSGRSC